MQYPNLFPTGDVVKRKSGLNEISCVRMDQVGRDPPDSPIKPPPHSYTYIPNIHTWRQTTCYVWSISLFPAFVFPRCSFRYISQSPLCSCTGSQPPADPRQVGTLWRTWTKECRIWKNFTSTTLMISVLSYQTLTDCCSNTLVNTPLSSHFLIVDEVIKFRIGVRLQKKSNTFGQFEH